MSSSVSFTSTDSIVKIVVSSNTARRLCTNIRMRSSRFFRLVVPTIGAVTPIIEIMCKYSSKKLEATHTFLRHHPSIGNLSHANGLAFGEFFDPLDDFRASGRGRVIVEPSSWDDTRWVHNSICHTWDLLVCITSSRGFIERAT